MEHQDLGKRIIAYIIDMAIIGIVAGMYGSVLSCGSQFFITINFGAQARDNMIFAFIYFIVFALFNNGKTIGKIALHLDVVTIDGDEVSRNQMLLREALKSLFLPLAVVSLILAIFVDHQQTLHDLIVKTTVVVEEEQTIYDYDDKNDYDEDDDHIYYE